eukprot:362961-Chlamydomonas_euryale.AAC.4
MAGVEQLQLPCAWRSWMAVTHAATEVAQLPAHACAWLLAECRIAGADIKDKEPLMVARRSIERDMERFKVRERRRALWHSWSACGGAEGGSLHASEAGQAAAHIEARTGGCILHAREAGARHSMHRRG